MVSYKEYLEIENIKRKNKNKYFYGATVILFLLIGTGCILTTCNPNSDFCILYTKIDGHVNKLVIQEQICHTCTHRKPRGKCTKYHDYKCWDITAYAIYNSQNQTCKLNIVNNEKSKSKVKKIESTYFIGKKVNWLINKNYRNDICFFENSTTPTWYTGVTFLSLTGLVIMCFLNLPKYLYEFIFKIYRGVCTCNPDPIFIHNAEACAL